MHLDGLAVAMKRVFWIHADLEFVTGKGLGSGPMEQNTKGSGSQVLCRVLVYILPPMAKSNMR